MRAKNWLTGWLIITASVFCIVIIMVYKVDPYFHYHKPKTDKYFYELNNQRSQNDGISQHFDYDAIITGSSMIENFRTTEAEELFKCNFIKLPYSGGTYKEINDSIRKSLISNSHIKLVIRCLDMGKYLASADEMRTDLGQYPDYLYDNNPFNDAEYLLNRDIVFDRVCQMIMDTTQTQFKPGITSFDDYSRWQASYSFGIKTVCPDGISVKQTTQLHLSDEEKERIKKNIELNVTDLADQYPDVDFYLFYSPYSVVIWNSWKTSGTLMKMLEAEALITELIIPHKNIHLFSFNNRTDLTSDLNNYKDGYHYASWINSLILKWMHEGKYQLTNENYKEYLQQEYDFYTSFNCTSIIGQEDYEADYYAAALLNEELTGIKPLDILNNSSINVDINGATIIAGDKKLTTIDCHGTLSRDYATEDLIAYLWKKEYIGIKFQVNLDNGYNYLCFDGQKIKDHGSLTAYVYNDIGELIGKVEAKYNALDKEIHHYAIDLSAIQGTVTIILNGGYTDYTGNGDSSYQFSNIFMY